MRIPGAGDDGQACHQQREKHAYGHQGQGRELGGQFALRPRQIQSRQFGVCRDVTQQHGRRFWQ